MAAIIFDFDGTIADTLDYFVDFLSREAKLPPLSPQQRKELHGLSLVGVARSLGHPWIRIPGLYFKGRRLMQPFIKDMEVFPGMVEVIEKLHAEGHELFLVSSNSVRNIRNFLHNHKLHTYFLQIYGGVVVFGKAPTIRRLLRSQNIDIKDALYIGDELRDVQAAQSINLRIIAVTWGFAREHDLVEQKPTGLAHTPEDIIRLLEEL